MIGICIGKIVTKSINLKISSQLLVWEPITDVENVFINMLFYVNKEDCVLSHTSSAGSPSLSLLKKITAERAVVEKKCGYRVPTKLIYHPHI